MIKNLLACLIVYLIINMLAEISYCIIKWRFGRACYISVEEAKDLIKDYSRENCLSYNGYDILEDLSIPEGRYAVSFKIKSDIVAVVIINFVPSICGKLEFETDKNIGKSIYAKVLVLDDTLLMGYNIYSQILNCLKDIELAESGDYDTLLVSVLPDKPEVLSDRGYELVKTKDEYRNLLKEIYVKTK